MAKLPQKVISKFSLVDLAGSERLSEGEKTGDRVEEAKYINKSLSSLGNVIYSLKNKHAKKKKKGKTSHVFKRHHLRNSQNHIPYRDSKLTHILKDSLGGNSHTHIIITLSPGAGNL